MDLLLFSFPPGWAVGRDSERSGKQATQDSAQLCPSDQTRNGVSSLQVIVCVCVATKREACR